MGTRKFTSVATLQGHFQRIKPIPRNRDLKAWAKNEQRKAEQEEAAQRQKWADLIAPPRSIR